jgi:hypothetical protein
MYSAYEPPSGPIGTTNALTRSPTASRPIGPRTQHVNDGCSINSRHVGSRARRQLPRSSSGPERDIRWVNPRRMDADAALPRAGLRFGKVDDLEHLGTAEFGESDRSHARDLRTDDRVDMTLTCDLLFGAAARIRSHGRVL